MTKARSSAEVILSHDFEMCRQRTARLVERTGGSKDWYEDYFMLFEAGQSSLHSED